jgi:hypothetical protein
MSKVSMAEAAKLFEVSRPTLAKHRKEGKISADHVFVNGAKVWQFDMAELKRVYPRRGTPDTPPLHAGFSAPAPETASDLQAEIRLLQAKLDAAERLLEERQQHLDDLRRLLPAPEAKDEGQTAKRKIWWPF